MKTAFLLMIRINNVFLQNCPVQIAPKFKSYAWKLSPEDEAASKIMASARNRVLQEKKAEMDAAAVELRKKLENSLKFGGTSLSNQTIRMRLKYDARIKQQVLLDFLRRDDAFVTARNDIIKRHSEAGLSQIAAASFFKHFPRSEFLARSLDFNDLLSRANESLVSAAEKFDHTKGGFQPYAMNFIWNSLFDDFRRRPFSGTGDLFLRITGPQEENVPSPKSTPEYRWRNRRTRELFEELVVDALPGRQNSRNRQIFKDFLRGEYAYGERQELAKKYRLTEFAMNQVIYRCRKALQAKLHEQKYADLRDLIPSFKS